MQRLFIVDRSSYLLVTGRKRRLGQGNIFALVCHSVHGGCLVRGVSGPRGCLVPGVPGATGVRGPGGVPGPRGVLLPGRPPRRLLLRAVRILLECILVEFRREREHQFFLVETIGDVCPGFQSHGRWWIYVVKFWTRAPLPRGPNCLNFMQFLGKFDKIIC